jgi:hypothetical protein
MYNDNDTNFLQHFKVLPIVLHSRLLFDAELRGLATLPAAGKTNAWNDLK